MLTKVVSRVLFLRGRKGTTALPVGIYMDGRTFPLILTSVHGYAYIQLSQSCLKIQVFIVLKLHIFQWYLLFGCKKFLNLFHQVIPGFFSILIFSFSNFLLFSHSQIFYCFLFSDFLFADFHSQIFLFSNFHSQIFLSSGFYSESFFIFYSHIIEICWRLISDYRKLQTII